MRDNRPPCAPEVPPCRDCKGSPGRRVVLVLEARYRANGTQYDGVREIAGACGCDAGRRYIHFGLASEIAERWQQKGHQVRVSSDVCCATSAIMLRKEMLGAPPRAPDPVPSYEPVGSWHPVGRDRHETEEEWR